MNLNSIFKITKTISITFCMLLLMAGCGNTASQAPVPVEESADEVDVTPAETGSSATRADYLTLAEAKSIVLENAELTEENVHFVRTQLDTAQETARYDMEFLCETAAYNYSVNALTGEILSMSCESGSYDLAAFSSSDAAASASEIGAGQTKDGDTTASQPESAQDDSMAGSQSTTTQNGDTTGSQAATTQNGDTADSQTDAKQNGSTTNSQTDTKQPQNNNTSGASEQQYIGTEAAKLAALNHAGLKSNEVNFVHAHLESDDGIWQYDIEFHKDTTEYDYDIDALTGEVLSFDHDAEYYHHAQAANAGSEQITEEQAKQLALQHAGVAEKDAQRLQIKFDYDDGRGEYEVEWYVGRTEYSCDVDAVTGAILSYDKELD